MLLLLLPLTAPGWEHACLCVYTCMRMHACICVQVHVCIRTHLCEPPLCVYVYTHCFVSVFSSSVQQSAGQPIQCHLVLAAPSCRVQGLAIAVAAAVAGMTAVAVVASVAVATAMSSTAAASTKQQAQLARLFATMKDHNYDGHCYCFCCDQDLNNKISYNYN